MEGTKGQTNYCAKNQEDNILTPLIFSYSLLFACYVQVAELRNKVVQKNLLKKFLMKFVNSKVQTRWIAKRLSRADRREPEGLESPRYDRCASHTHHDR